MRYTSRGFELPPPPYPKHTRNVNMMIFDLRQRCTRLIRQWEAWEKRGRERQQ